MSRKVDKLKKLFSKVGSFCLKMELLHPGKLTCPLKRDYFSREYIFQPLIFMGYVSFREGVFFPPST